MICHLFKDYLLSHIVYVRYLYWDSDKSERESRDFPMELRDQSADWVIYGGVRSRTFVFGSGDDEEGVSDVRGKLIVSHHVQIKERLVFDTAVSLESLYIICYHLIDHLIIFFYRISDNIEIRKVEERVIGKSVDGIKIRDGKRRGIKKKQSDLRRYLVIQKGVERGGERRSSSTLSSGSSSERVY